ncbi:aquaporin-1-like [Brienomyrus brachyistius]|uniref:aquaporin-1-like n=1 Tax=Brienomyrus brachyistius TaxID=42636 RepID=UPI0020B40818|nr:aquaporin-1-like [Brienomyrus brachyistius]
MSKELKSKTFWRAAFAELLGTTLFMFLSISAAVGNQNKDGPDQEVKVAFSFGLAIATLSHSLGHVSGAHFNPAVTLGLLTSCQISILRATMYILAQMLGATVASGLVCEVKPSNVSGLGVNTLNRITPIQGIGIELLATFQLVLCVIATTDKRQPGTRSLAPLAVGFSVCLGHLAAVSYTGCGINPARSFGPAVVTGNFENHWVYWVGPLCGGVMAALVYDLVLCPKQHLSDRVTVLFSGRGGECSISKPEKRAEIEVPTKV